MAGSNSNKKHPRISSYMKHLLDQYRTIRGESKNKIARPFWDIVVITASDVVQQTAFQLQINDKVSRQEIPADLPIHIITDPPGIRIGNGGSTLTCLEVLHKEYGQKLFDLKILLIHAGGWSQRMPSATALGKIFSILPHGDPPFQMLDLKLALYWPFVERIQPGVFLVCADDFVVFDLENDKEWKIPAHGFTALAHPAPLEVGKSHGVYVLAEGVESDVSKPIKICKCRKVLQKPTEAHMKSEGAVLKGNSFTFGDGISLKGEVIYTDSCFYFGTDIIRKLLKMKKSVGDLSCEIDAYGDFLQAVGENATNDYIHLTFNVSQPTPNLLEMRERVFDTLNGSDIHVLILNSSKFIHIGTTKELLHHFCHNEEFQQQMCLGRNVFNSWVKVKGDEQEEHLKQGKWDDDSKTGKADGCNRLSENACLIHCSLDERSVIGSDCFLEFCNFEVPAILSNFCILSNCEIIRQEWKQESFTVPSHVFLHTIPIEHSGKEGIEFVTIFFHIEDNLKKSVASQKDLGVLPFMGSTVTTFMAQQGIDVHDVMPADEASESSDVIGKETDGTNTKNGNNLNSSVEKLSLWNLKLYRAHPSMTSSLKDALTILTSSNQLAKKRKLSHKLYSMADLSKIKSVARMLNFRQSLFDRIVKAK